MGGKYSRDKGARGERETVLRFKAERIPAKRISMMESAGIDKGDVEIDGRYRLQVKVGDQCPVFHERALGDYTALVTHRDKGRWLVTVDMKLFCQLWRDAESERRIRERWEDKP
jgi:hypothetical protein